MHALSESFISELSVKPILETSLQMQLYDWSIFKQSFPTTNQISKSETGLQISIFTVFRLVWST